MHFSQSIKIITSFIMRMEQWISRSTDTTMAELCRAGLLELQANADDYDACTLVATFFKDELLRHLTEEVTDDTVFALIEDLAVIIREKTLRCSLATSEEKKILEYFEQSGNWEIGDGTLISMFYYVHVPVVIERERFCEKINQTSPGVRMLRKAILKNSEPLAVP